MSHPYSRTLRTFTPLSLRTQALEWLKLLFEDYKSQVNNRLAEIDHIGEDK